MFEPPVQPDRADLAPYAFRDAMTAGRLHPRPPHPYRGPFQRDRDRIIHCAAWRRLSEKTQVFTSELGDYHRTRLTHTLEVTNLARTLARALRLNEDLVEALALLHDVGHPPFGHTGEEALDILLRRESEKGTDDTKEKTDDDVDNAATFPRGGFNHNEQALRIVEKLERRYPDFPGLNLSFEILDGQRYKVRKKHAAVAESPLLEVQLVDVADSVSYDSHDADDAIELDFLKPGDLAESALWRRAETVVRSRWTDLDEQEFRQAVIHALIDIQVGNILDTTRNRVRDLVSLEQVRAGGILVGPDPELAEQKKELEDFLFSRVYRHPRVVLVRRRLTGLIRELFEYHLLRPDALPERYALVLSEEGEARAVADYLADMTDRGIRLEHRRLLDSGKVKPRSPLQKRS